MWAAISAIATAFWSRFIQWLLSRSSGAHAIAARASLPGVSAVAVGLGVR